MTHDPGNLALLLVIGGLFLIALAVWISLITRGK